MKASEKCKKNLKSGVSLFLWAQGKRLSEFNSLNSRRVLREPNGAIAAAGGESKRFRQGTHNNVINGMHSRCSGNSLQLNLVQFHPVVQFWLLYLSRNATLSERAGSFLSESVALRDKEKGQIELDNFTLLKSIRVIY